MAGKIILRTVPFYACKSANHGTHLVYCIVDEQCVWVSARARLYCYSAHNHQNMEHAMSMIECDAWNALLPYSLGAPTGNWNDHQPNTNQSNDGICAPMVHGSSCIPSNSGFGPHRQAWASCFVTHSLGSMASTSNANDLITMSASNSNANDLIIMSMNAMDVRCNALLSWCL